jgi:glycerol-3-phosphate dehydrogenase (NAD(P)+)
VLPPKRRARWPTALEQLPRTETEAKNLRMNITVLGAGAWGTALAIQASASHSTLLWARDAQQVSDMRTQGRNARYLLDAALPPALRLTENFEAASAHADGGLIVIATPMAGLAEMLRRLNSAVTSSTGVLWLCKGFQEQTGQLGHEIARDSAPQLTRVGVLSGPSFAAEVARQQPTALVAASTDLSLTEDAVSALHSESLRIYTSTDAVGVEVGGAVKNVLAIATGLADGMALGMNARAALITRGLTEMTRLGVALGARAPTFMGLSGLGDLVLTATGDLSRNRQVGMRLAQGLPLAQILTDLGHVAEGVRSAQVVLQRAKSLGVDMPITAAVVSVLNGQLTPTQALQNLMGRDARAEV